MKKKGKKTMSRRLCLNFYRATESRESEDFQKLPALAFTSSFELFFAAAASSLKA